jgi:hypothetical protein
MAKRYPEDYRSSVLAVETDVRAGPQARCSDWTNDCEARHPTQKILASDRCSSSKRRSNVFKDTWTYDRNWPARNHSTLRNAGCSHTSGKSDFWPRVIWCATKFVRKSLILMTAPSK